MTESDKAALDIAVGLPLILGLLGGSVLGLQVNSIVGLAAMIAGLVWSIKAHRALEALDAMAQAQASSQDRSDFEQ